MKKWLLLASLLVIIGGIGVALTWSKFSGYEEVHEQEQKDAKNIDSLNIKSTVATVKVIPTDRDQITVTFDGNYKKNQKGSLKVETKDRTLFIQQTMENKFFNVSFGFKMPSAQLLVEVPKKQWDQIAVTGDVGSIKLEDVTANSFKVSSDVGSIQLRGLKAKIFDISSDVGSIKAYDNDGEFNLKNSTGSIYIEQQTINSPIIAKNDVGSIKIKVQEKPANAYIDAASDVGSIRIFGEKRSVKFGDGSIPIKLTTDTGSIKLED